MSDTPTVAALLEGARASHLAYRRLAAGVTKQGGRAQVVRQAPDVAAHLWDAYTLRQRAHAADPQHVDPAWAADTVPYDELMAFYEHQLRLQK